MKLFIVFALFLSLSMSATISPAQTPNQKQWQNLKLSSGWAKVILNFAEIKNQTGGAFEDLAEAIKDLVEDLEAKSARATAEFSDRTALHEQEVTRLNSLIDSANYDISSTQEFLDAVLYVQKADLESTIANLEQSIANTQQYIEDENKLREQNVLIFNQKVAEHQDAIAALEECLALTDQLNEGGLSLAQKMSAKSQFERLKTKLGQNIDATLVESLVALASSEFADADILANLVNLLNQVKNNLIASAAKLQDEEEAAIQAYEADIATKTADINRMVMEKTENSVLLEQTNEQIENSEQFIAERKDDLEDFQEELQDENEAYQVATDNYNALIDQINKELHACETALELVENYDIAGYIENRVDQDVVIDQPHGNTVQVNDNEI